MRTLTKAWKTKELRYRVLYTLMILLFIRAVSQIVVPGVDASFLTDLFNGNETLGLINTFTGGGLEKFSVLALSITPYITASIVIQLLTIAFPRLEQLAKEGESGRKKLEKYTQRLTLVLAIVESISMCISFRNYMIISNSYSSYILIVATLTGGSMSLIWLGNRITEKGIGNGISMILLVNILSRMPQDAKTVYANFIQGQNTPKMILNSLVIAAIVIVIICLTVILNAAERRIPVVYTKKIQRNRFGGADTSNIPMKVNTAGVMPVIFASTIMTFPAMIFGILGKQANGVWATINNAMNSNNWFNPSNLAPTLGYLVYVLLLFFFAYFYTIVTFNPIEISNNLKKTGAVIPGKRPGKDTQDYLQKVLKNVIAIGAIGLLIICTIPLVINGLTKANISFGGTSLIIVVSVILETAKQCESLTKMKNANTFLR